MALTLAQKLAYDSETGENFRWISSLLATKSAHILTSSDLVDEEILSQLSAIGQYTEIAHGSISPSFVFRHLEELCSPGKPLEYYHALKYDGAQLVKHFVGDGVAGVQGYVTYRPTTHQLLVAFSGTSSPAQGLKNMKTWRTTYPRDPARSTVHAGFWENYGAVRSHAYEALRLGFQDSEYKSDIRELVLTGHSMGCTLCYLLALDLMAEMEEGSSALPHGVTIKLALFGSPRLGNQGLVDYWRRCVGEYVNKFGRNSFVEYSIKGYNDGVPTLPPRSLGFRHLTESPLYFYHSCLYHIPASENEHSAFTIEEGPSTLTKTPALVTWPRGGHNYYSDRDMEKLQRCMQWLNISLHGEDGWQERYTSQLRKWEAKWRKYLAAE